MTDLLRGEVAVEGEDEAGAVAVDHHGHPGQLVVDGETGRQLLDQSDHSVPRLLLHLAGTVQHYRHVPQLAAR